MALMNDIVVRFYLNGEWRDVSGHVRAEAGISYSRGRRGEGDTTPPASCSLTLDNGEGKGDGDYTEQNPMGTYYGYLGRFTPAEVKLRHVRDTATTSASNGWDTTDTHPQGAWNVESWTTSGTAADFSKSSGTANVAVTAAGQTKVAYLASYRGRDVGVSLTWSSTLTNVTGTNLGSGVCPANILLRGQGALSSYYMLRLVIQTDETITLDWWDQTSTSITGGAISSGVTYVAGASYRTRVEIEGRTLRVKLWAATDPEPFGWTDEFTDEGDDKDTPPTLADVQGWVGIRTSHTGTNTNGSTTYSYDDIEVYSFIAAGEVAQWPQAQDTTGNDQTVQVTINGPRGRLATSKTIARSALYQQILIKYYGGFSPVPDAYFPLEDGLQTVTDTIKSAVGGNSNLRFEVQAAPANTTVGTVSWGAETTLPGTKQAPTVKGGGALFATILPPTSAVDWGFAFAAKLNYADGFLMSASSSPDAGVDPMYWRIRMSPDSTVVEVDLLRTGAVVIPMMTYDLGSKEAVEGWHTFILEASDVGADVAYFLFVDGVQEDVYTDTGGTLQGVAYVNLGTVDNATGGISYAHLAVWGNLILNVNTEAYHNAAIGSPGEWPVYRAGRLAEEYGYGYGWIGFGGVTGSSPSTSLPGDGSPMGAQRVTNLLDLFNDCEKLDGGILYEQRSRAALMFRTLASMSGRSSWVTFDVATSKHLSALAPVPDDRELCNRFTARRDDGGEYIYSLDTGPMSTLPPNEGGVGLVDRSDSFNAVDESALPSLARYRVARGTIQQERYPNVVVELHRPAVYETSGLVSKLNDLDIGDQVTLSGLTSWRVYDNRDVLVIGISGQLDLFRHTKNLATVPAELTRVLRLSASVAASTEASRIGSGYTTIDEDLTTTETDVTVEVEANRAFWVNSVSHATRFPFDVICGGEVMRVTAGTAPSGQNQTWTVARSINGVVKTHSAGSKIDLFRKNYLGL